MGLGDGDGDGVGVAGVAGAADSAAGDASAGVGEALGVGGTSGVGDAGGVSESGGVLDWANATGAPTPSTTLSTSTATIRQTVRNTGGIIRETGYQCAIQPRKVRRRRVSQILFQAIIYLPDACAPGPRSLGVPPTPASASGVNGRAWGCSREDYPFHSRAPRRNETCGHWSLWL